MADTVLLVDYDPRNIAKVRSWLVDAGLEVRLALDGEAAIEAFRELRPDLVVLQDLLPKRHGFEVCRQIKRIANDVAVVLLANARNGRRYEILNTGCDGFVQKPVAESDLLDAIRPHVALPDRTPKHVPGTGPVPEATPSAPPVAAASVRPFVLPDRIDETDIDATLEVVFAFGGEVAPEAVGPPAAVAEPGPAPAPDPEPAKTSRRKTARKKTKTTGSGAAKRGGAGTGPSKRSPKTPRKRAASKRSAAGRGRRDGAEADAPAV